MALSVHIQNPEPNSGFYMHMCVYFWAEQKG